MNRVSARTQLNININPRLMKIIKKNAINSEMTVGDYVNSLIKCYLAEKEIGETNEGKLDRLDELEKKLLNTNELINKLIDS